MRGSGVGHNAHGLFGQFGYLPLLD